MDEKETQTIFALVRDYTELPGLQHAGRVEYALCRDAGGLALRLCGPAGQGASCAVPHLAEPAAGALLRFLYENAVPAAQLRDVVQDLCWGLAVQP